MDVVVAGGHGQIGLLLTETLVGRGHRVRGLIRNPDHAQDVRDRGGEPVLCDLESVTADVVAAIAGADAFVFAAGAGPGSGPRRKQTVDRDAALLTVEACEQAGVRRYVMVSAMGAADPPQGDEVFAVYLRAKADADRAVASSDLAWTIVRPGRLTDDPPAGTICAGVRTGRGDIPRADVAAVLAEVLGDDDLAGVTFDVIEGVDAIPRALAGLRPA